MTTEQFFCIGDWAAWADNQYLASASSHTQGLGPRRTEPAAPVLLRRRISPLGQTALRCAWLLPGASTARIVCASRHGEFGRTLSILDSVLVGDVVSPADFTYSVHHALTGLLSIAQSNRRGHTTVSAGDESFGYGFLEALCCLNDRPQEPILFLYYDEALPPPYDRFDDAKPSPRAMALFITKSGVGDRLSLTVLPNDAGLPTSASVDMDFLRFLAAGEGEMGSQGMRAMWRWRRHASAN